MIRTFEFHARQLLESKETSLGRVTVATYIGGGSVYLGPVSNSGRVAAVYPQGKSTFFGWTTNIEPFGSEGIEQPHLRLTVNGQYVKPGTSEPSGWLAEIEKLRGN